MKSNLANNFFAKIVIMFMFTQAIFSQEDKYHNTIDIDSAIKISIANNKNLRFIMYNQRIEEERFKLLYRKFLPQLDFNFSQNDSVTYSSPDSRVKRLSIGISQLVFDAGRLSQNIKLQKIQKDLTHLGLEQQKEEIVLRTINLYIKILKFDLQKKIQKKTWEKSLLHYNIAKEEKKLGVITELDFLDIELAIKNLEIELEKTIQEEEILLFQFAKQLQIDPDKVPNPSGYINSNYNGFIQTFDADYYVRLMKKNNLDFMKKRTQVFIRLKELDQARWSWLPEISSNLELSMSGQKFPLTEPGFSIGLSFSFPLPVMPTQINATVGKKNPSERSIGLSYSSQIAENLEEIYTVALARLNLAKSSFDLESFEDDMGFNVKMSLKDIQNRKKMLELLKEKLNIATKRQNIQELKLRLGEVKRTEYISNEIELSKQKIAILSQIIDLYNTEVTFLRTFGISDFLQSLSSLILENDEGFF